MVTTRTSNDAHLIELHRVAKQCQISTRDFSTQNDIDNPASNESVINDTPPHN